jgi:glyoxylase-like metal-dependent hydrolase (beta-lactamase superfamily II)
MAPPASDVSNHPYYITDSRPIKFIRRPLFSPRLPGGRGGGNEAGGSGPPEILGFFTAFSVAGADIQEFVTGHRKNIIDADYDLNPFGIEGRVVPTPGHSRGSVSVILESGEAFVGDTGFNVPFVSRKSVFPPWAEDVAVLGESWKKLLLSGARMFYPGHGRPFDREKLRRSLDLKYPQAG